VNRTENRAHDPAVRERVMDAALELGYVPNAAAQRLRGRRNRTVGVIVRDVGLAANAAVLRGIREVAHGANYLMVVADTKRWCMDEPRWVQRFHEQRVELVVIAASGVDDTDYTGAMAEAVGAFEADGGRVVVIGRHDLDVASIRVDNVRGAYDLATSMLAMGHRRFGVIGGNGKLTLNRDRLSGVRAALADGGIDLDRDVMYLEGAFTREHGNAAARHLTMQKKPPTAIVGLSDDLALGAYRALREQNLAVPRDVSLGGIDDLAPARALQPALTTVSYRHLEIGARAMRAALDPYLGHDAVEVHYELALRETVAAPREQRTHRSRSRSSRRTDEACATPRR